MGTTTATERERTAGTARPWPVLAFGLGVGLVGGALTLYGQRLLAGAGGWFMLVNSAAPWLMFAFLAGTRARGRWWTGAAAGVLAEVGLVAGYYLIAQNGAQRTMLIWAVTGLVAGPVYGLAGSVWRDRRHLLRVAALGLLGGAWIADGIHALQLASGPGESSGPGVIAAWSAMTGGVLLPLVLGRSMRDRLFGVLATIPVLALITVAGAAVNAAF